MTAAIAIAPRMYSNVMDYALKIVASANIKSSDRKGGNAGRNIDHIGEKDGHLIILFGALPVFPWKKHSLSPKARLGGKVQVQIARCEYKFEHTRKDALYKFHKMALPAPDDA